MDLVLLLGRLLFGALFIVSGMGHFAKREAMVGYAKYKTVPMAGLGVALSGLVFLIGGAAIVLGVFAGWASLAIAIVLAVTAFVMHAYWKESDAAAKQNEMMAFNKDISLVGASLIAFYLFHQFSSQIGMLIAK
ncbi:MAG: DoxX family protein [Candidatus Nanopelagicales bacterium]